ncbi:MAG: epoxyqueuosine reductase QueH [Lachnospiraceae bacterium]|nr:epoxyqueuosine reductase QueH [Lachnospiraceae bacterium]
MIQQAKGNNTRNYQKELDKILEQITKDESEKGQRLLLHSCCAPCSSYVLEYLRQYFRITVFYYNPNISMEPEYRKRVEEQKRLIAKYNALEGKGYEIDVIEGDYEPATFYEIAKGLEQCPEGGERCFACYELRLLKTAILAQEGQYDYFSTTLTISPLKNAQKLNEIGERLSLEYQIPWLVSDFKKKNGYKRSIELSAEYDLYRQDYCGCIYSIQERERIKQEKNQDENL